MRKRKARRGSARRCAVLLLLALLLALPPLSPAAAEEGHDVRRITLSAVGDCTLGRNQKMIYYESWDHLYERYGSDYFLQHVAAVFQNDDLTIANLECSISDQQGYAATTFSFLIRLRASSSEEDCRS